METEFRIKIPEGMEIDKERSTFECIKFKPKKITYFDVTRHLSYTRAVYVAKEEHKSKCVIFRKLLEVADYLNGDWKPDWNNQEQCKYIIRYNHISKQFSTDFYTYTGITPIVFSSRENALKAIEIIGEEELKNFFLSYERASY